MDREQNLPDCTGFWWKHSCPVEVYRGYEGELYYLIPGNEESFQVANAEGGWEGPIASEAPIDTDARLASFVADAKEEIRKLYEITEDIRSFIHVSSMGTQHKGSTFIDQLAHHNIAMRTATLLLHLEAVFYLFGFGEAPTMPAVPDE